MYSPAIQAAGHEGVLQNSAGDLFIKPRTTQQEQEFYEKLASSDELSEFQSITPVYMGTLTEQQVKSENTDLKDYDLLMEQQNFQGDHKIQNIVEPVTSDPPVELVLQNMMHGFTRPNIIDIKLGSILWDEGADEAKRSRLDEVSRTTTSGSLNFRIAGMNIYNPETKERQFYDKMFGRSVTPENIINDGIGKFFPQSIEAEKSRALCQGIKEELQYMYNVVMQSEVHMISASVLIIYEADPKAFDEKLEIGNAAAENDYTEEEEEEEDDDDDDDKIKPLFIVKLIDFAHTKHLPGMGPDYNSIKGIENLIDIFEKLEDMHSKM